MFSKIDRVQWRKFLSSGLYTVAATDSSLYLIRTGKYQPSLFYERGTVKYGSASTRAASSVAWAMMQKELPKTLKKIEDREAAITPDNLSNLAKEKDTVSITWSGVRNVIARNPTFMDRLNDQNNAPRLVIESNQGKFNVVCHGKTLQEIEAFAAEIRKKLK